MVNLNIRHELKLLSRNFWFVSLSLVLVLLCLYAGHNGLKHYERRTADQQEALAAQQAK
tara:strand:- start:71 stop:247 length:177 start_codon:yes stop_codon:yes gene_type:complete